MISLTQHRAAITSRVISRFSDETAPQLGLSSWFPSETTADYAIRIEVERSLKLIAEDVQRNKGGKVNTFSHFKEKLYVPPFYEEQYDFTQAQYYDVTFRDGNNPTQSQAFSMIKNASEKLNRLKHKIQRAIEKQRSEVFHKGVVKLKNGDDIDFKRKKESMIVLNGDEKWSSEKSDPLKKLSEGIKFIREEGNSSSVEFDLIMGEEVLGVLMNNVSIKEKADIRRFNVLEIGTTKFSNKTGLAFHGRLSTTNGNIDLWTYHGHYNNSDGSKSNYVDSNSVILLPRDFVGKTAYAGIPGMTDDSKFSSVKEAEFHIDDFIDKKYRAHWFRIASAPLVVPISVDRVWTARVI